MQHLNIILSLAVAGLAIDIRLHERVGCSGFALQCGAANPTVCCYADLYYPSIGFYGIPIDWDISVYGYRGGRCSSLAVAAVSKGQTFMCLAGDLVGYTGAVYKFNGKKRDVGIVEQECQKPDTLILEDGHEYDITNMDSSVLDEFMAIAANVTEKSGIPEAFRKLEKNS